MLNFFKSIDLKSPQLKWLWLTAFMLVLDWSVKYFMFHWLESEWNTVEVLPVFNFTLAFNEGAGFSFLSNMGGWQRWLFAGIAIVMSVYLFAELSKIKPEFKMLPAAYALIIAGALGNLGDRLLLGKVVDFLHFHWFTTGPSFAIFNIADVAVSCGAAGMAYVFLFNKKALL